VRGEPVFDAAIVGAGPAGRIAAMVLAGAGQRVAVVDAAPDRQAPQAAHVHRIDDATWDRLTALLPSLAQDAAFAGAPTAALGADTLHGPLGDRMRPFPHRHQLDAALRQACRRHSGVTVVAERVRCIERAAGLWRLAGLRARWLVDASGSARATLAGVSRFGRIDELRGRTHHAYVSQRFCELKWPAGRIGHAARDAGVGLIARRVDVSESLVTLQLDAGAVAPGSTHAFLDRAARADAEFARQRLGAAAAAGPTARWRCRRASGLDAEPDAAPECWFAIGDALLTTPPHQGQGLAQIAEQAAMLAGAGLASARARLLEFARGRLLAATLADRLGVLAETDGAVPG
jgi:2-polyprenyl-6-methoxyphenol hydroxylase-like FAD-dependent oxidoreductase